MSKRLASSGALRRRAAVVVVQWGGAAAVAAVQAHDGSDERPGGEVEHATHGVHGGRSSNLHPSQTTTTSGSGGRIEMDGGAVADPPK